MNIFMKLYFYLNYKPTFNNNNKVYMKNFIIYLFFFLFFKSQIGKMYLKKKKVMFCSFLNAPNSYKKTQKKMYFNRYILIFFFKFNYKFTKNNMYVYMLFLKKKILFFESSLIFLKIYSFFFFKKLMCYYDKF